MQNKLKALRYFIFGIFIICNAIVASAAVWNHSLVDLAKRTSGEQIDLYLIFLGCFGLALIFTIIFVELACKSPITGRVWFECAWVGLFCIFYLAGAIAVSIITPGEHCKLQVSSSLPLLSDSCNSTRVIMAFSWLNTVILLSYFLLLVVASLIHLKHDSRIWHRYVYKFPWSELRRSAPSAPSSPALPQFLKKMPSIVAPKPQRVAPNALYNYRSGLSLEYEIEHYRPPTRPPSHIQGPATGIPVPPVAYPFDPGRTTRQPTTDPPSFYPQYMQSALTPTLQQSDLYILSEPNGLPSPSPLGDWPRPNAVMQPLRSKRDRLQKSENVTAGEYHPKSTLRSRPSGPRRKLGAVGSLQSPVQESGTDGSK